MRSLVSRLERLEVSAAQMNAAYAIDHGYGAIEAIRKALAKRSAIMTDEEREEERRREEGLTDMERKRGMDDLRALLDELAHPKE
jgi:hypothetical protein